MGDAGGLEVSSGRGLAAVRNGAGTRLLLLNLQPDTGNDSALSSASAAAPNEASPNSSRLSHLSAAPQISTPS